MFLRNASRPAARQHEFQRFRLSDPYKWLSQDGLDEIEYSEGDSAVGVNPVPQILTELDVKYRLPLRLSVQIPSPGEA